MTKTKGGPPGSQETRSPGDAERPRLAEDHFRLLVQGVKDYAIFMLDPRGHVLSWNAGAERIKGYEAGEITGQHFSRFYPPEDIAAGKPDRELEIAIETGKFEEEGWRLRKDGSRFWAHVVLTALRGSDGELRGFAKVTRDMTERLTAEETARRLLAEEAARVAAEAGRLEALRAHQDERRQREQLRVTLRSIGDGVAVTDADGRITFLNPEAESLTGWTSEQAAGRPIEEVLTLVHEETREPVGNPARRALRERAVVGLANHTLLVARDGREIPIDDSAAPIEAAEGELSGVVLVFRDVTQARRAAEARSHLAAIVESSDDAILSKNLDGTILSWNAGAERLYGYKADEVVGRHISLLVPPEQVPELEHIMERLRQGLRVEHFETVRRRKDGRLVHVSLTISPVRDQQGRLVGASKIARDVSLQKRHEASWRFLAEASAALVSSPDAPSAMRAVARLAVPLLADACAADVVGHDGTLERVAVASVDPVGLSAKELERILPTDARGIVARVLRSGRLEMQEDVPEARGPEAPGAWTRACIPMRSRDRILGVLSFVAALGGRRMDAHDLRLVEDVANRAAVALESARLNAELRLADRRKDEFLAMLGHELRNPLAPIRNAVEVLALAGEQDPTQVAQRQIIERQLGYLTRLVDDLLDVSRIMKGRIGLRREPVDVASVLATAVETVQPVLDARRQAVIVSAPEEPAWLDADPARLAQVVGNLLQNASKFSEPGQRIWLGAERRGNEVLLSVRDEGLGIARDLLPDVFDLFVQGDSSLERTQGGLGIGLTVVKRLVELHGGTVAIGPPRAGRGTEAVVRLPALEGGPRLTSGHGAAAPRLAARRVLVVDDNVDAAQGTVILLRLWGHEAHLAHDGAEALRLAHEVRPDVVVLDIGLPGMSGYEIARRLREMDATRAAKLIALTGYGQKEDRDRALEAGFDHHLTKPVPPAVLQDVVSSARPQP